MNSRGADEQATAIRDEPHADEAAAEEPKPGSARDESHEAGSQREEPQAGQSQAGQSQAGGPVRQPKARRAAALPRLAATRAGQLPLRWRITSMALLGALAAAATVSAVLLGVAAHHDDVVSRAGTAARAAAAAEIPQILSYDYRSINSDLARASGDTTGEFRQQFSTLASQIIAPAAVQQQTVTKATVPNSSVVSATDSQVVVLLFVDQATTSKGQRQPQRVASQVRVTMQQAGGRWLVAQFQAL